MAQAYAIGPRFFAVLTTVPDTIERLMYPILSRKILRSETDQIFAFERFLKLALCLAAPMAVGMAIVGSDLVRVVCGEQYVADTSTAIVFVWMIAFAMLDRAVVVFMRAKSLQRSIAWLYGFAFLTKLVLSIPIIHRFGTHGLLMLNLIISAALTCLMLRIAMKVVRGFSILRLLDVSVRPLLASLCMGIAVWQARDFPLVWVFAIAFAAYGLALIMLGGVDKFDRQLLRETIRPTRHQ
jgi:O-antigen/teichoic acid export membrane protein